METRFHPGPLQPCIVAGTAARSLVQSLRPGLGWIVILAGFAGLGGCAGDQAARLAINDFDRADFGSAAVGFRAGAEARPFNENSLLNNARLGMAALAAGDIDTSVGALGTAYKLLESGGVNDESRIFAATVLHEGVLVYKGEPFEQAMTYTALAWGNALKGDWENVRVCARASVRRLADFQQADPNAKDRMAREGVKLVESTFALGYLLEGVANHILNEPGDALDRAVSLNGSLRPVADAVKSGRFNTLVVVDWGRGPAKSPRGDDNAQTQWVPLDESAGEMRVTVPGEGTLAFSPAADVNRMSADYRWNNLGSARAFKSGLGTVLVVGGVTTAAASENKSAQIAGLAAAGAGLLMKLLASADTRHNELLPARVFVAALELPAQGADITIGFSGGRTAPITIPAARPGTPSSPSVFYVRSLTAHGVRARPVTSWGYNASLQARSADDTARQTWEPVPYRPGSD